MFSSKLLSWSLLCCSKGVIGLLSPQSLGSSVSILIDNDLQGPSSPTANSGVLVLEPQLFQDASKSCKALGEQLWSPELKTASIQSELDYLKYSNDARDLSEFWIASANAGTQRKINSNGVISSTRSNLALPVLCTQTAPFSNSTYQDNTDTKWQITVHSNNEYLTGFRDRLSFRFLGIRYAPQPERFTYSTLYTGNGSVVSATEYGGVCYQAGQGGEDCQFLNIWTPYLPGPKSSSAALRPVLFWIHGGAFTSGYSSDPTFDGGNVASRSDMVVVAINYRLGTFGFLALDDGVTNGNYGFADQITALDWVRKNIQDFGGDPDRITIIGQSAGAGSVRAMMASPQSIGKFKGAVPLSNLGGINYGTTYSQYLTIDEEMTTVGNDILASTNCTNAASQVDCLRSVPGDTLNSIPYTARYLVVDGKYLVTDELELHGPQLPVHLLMGTMRDDGAAFISYPTTTNQSDFLTSQGFNLSQADLFPIPDIANKTLALYNSTSRLYTDGVFRCIDQATVYAGLQNNKFEDVHYYEFNRSYQTTGWPGYSTCEAPVTPSHPYGDPNAEYFKCHSGELYFVFGNILRVGVPFRDEFDLPFEQYIVDAFSSFARTYNPNPDMAYLKARGYTNTIQELERSGSWEAAMKGDITKRILQWPTITAPFIEVEQCNSLELPLNYYITGH
ncbi:cholinesterase [Xylariaceae sp. FL0255]|nr:cholinesterase [Xylariaceae sp. FL0255]